MTCKNSVIIIPARLNSSRLKQKLMLPIGDKSIIEHTYLKCLKSKISHKTLIVADCKKMFNHCKTFTSDVFLSLKEHNSGTDRIVEFVLNNNQYRKIVNVQADEPFISPKLIDDVFINLNQSLIVTAAYKNNKIEKFDPNLVKVVVDFNSNALYFSRSEIPFYRDGNKKKFSLIHHGIYGYQFSFLEKIPFFHRSSLEEIEKLEQLKFIENGAKIKVILSEERCFGIDTIEDYNKAIKIFENEKNI